MLTSFELYNKYLTDVEVDINKHFPGKHVDDGTMSGRLNVGKARANVDKIISYNSRYIIPQTF